LKVDPCRRLIEYSLVVDWRISEYELVDDDQASHVDNLDKPVFLFSENEGINEVNNV